MDPGEGGSAKGLPGRGDYAHPNEGACWVHVRNSEQAKAAGVG